MPDRLFSKFHSTAVGVTAPGTAGVFATSALNVNDCKDPLGAWGSGAPVGFANLCSSTGYYGAYIVHAFSVHMVMYQASGNSSSVVTMMPRVTGAAPATSAQEAISNPRCKSVIVDQGNHSHLYLYASVAEVYGQSPQTVAIADSFSALYSAAPGSAILVDIGRQDTAVTTANNISYTIKLTQWVELFGRVVS